MTLLGFVGDVFVDRENPDAIFEQVADVIAVPDLMFAAGEAPYTATPHLAPTAALPLFAHPDNATAFRHFDVVAVASNHIVDAGHDAMLETLELIRAAGATPIGAGKDIAEAGRPASFTTPDGHRVSYLAYGSVFPHGYEARERWPGIAPLRATNQLIERTANYWLPGVAGTVISIPHADDHVRAASDISAEASRSDVVVASFHWGDSGQPFALTDHERRTARFAIDHGADVVVGHHQHLLRGIEWYRGRPIFYGLGQFALDLGRLAFPPDHLAATSGLADDESYQLYPRAGWPFLPMHPEARLSLVAWVQLRAGKPAAAGFVPCTLGSDGRVQPHDGRSPEGTAVQEYLERACRHENLNAELAVSEQHAIAGLASIVVSDPLSSQPLGS